MFWDIVKALSFSSKPKIAPLLRRALVLGIFLFSAPSLVVAQSISIGPFGAGISTGTEPFNTTGVCTDSGDDCSSIDTRIRSNDTQAHLYSLIVSGIPSGDPDVDAVIFEQTVTPNTGAIVEFDDIPPICLAPPAGSGGTNPLSSITQNADGSSTLLCNLGSMGNGDQKSFSLELLPSAESIDGSTFTTTVNSYGLDAGGNVIIANTPYDDGNTYEISAAPAWDLIGDRQPIYSATATSRDMGTGRGVEPGYLLYTTAHLAADATRDGKGTSKLTNNFSFDFGLEATASDGTPFPIETDIIHCLPNTSGWAQVVFGSEAALPTRPIEQKVVDSGTCTWTGDPTSGFTMNIANADTSGSRYPTETANGTSLLDGPFFVASFRVAMFVPFSEIEREDPVPNSGTLELTQCMNNFDPVDEQGISNYGAGLEPGHNGTLMPDGSASNNCTGPLTLELSVKGAYNYRAISRYNAAHAWGYDPYISAYHTGDGVVEPTVGYAYFHYLANTGSVGWNNSMLCSTFDNSTQKLTDRSNIGHTAGDYAFARYLGGTVEADWQIEYASVDQSNVDPLDSDSNGATDFNPTTGRYDGNWADLQNFRCDTAGVTWNTDASAIGIDDVNAVRVVPKDPSTTQYDAGANIWLIVPVEARDNFYGGPYAGTPMPAGTVLASHGNYRSDEYTPNGLNNLYQPSPENGWSHGDRMTFSRASLDVEKSTNQPLAATGVSTQILAGNEVIWQLQPSVTSVLATGSSATAVELVDVLPSELTYDSACTIANGSAPTAVLYNTPSQGETTLKWSLGDIHSLDTINPVLFCTSSDATAPDGTTVTNTAFLDASDSVRSGESEQSVILGQAGAIGASANVDVPVDLVNDAQVHTLFWSNFSVNTSIQAPVIVNVLPHAGDDAALSDRSPGSNFSGTLTLTGPATDTWSDGSTPTGADPFATIGTIYYSGDTPATINHNPGDNTSDWCSWNGSAFVPEVTGMSCPVTFADVTALKHVSNYDLAASPDARQGVELTYELQALGNSTQDQYTNVFGVDSADLPADQFVKSTRSVLNIVSYSIGDLVFVDVNANGVYDPVADQLMPDGLDVELYDAPSDTLLATTTTSNGTFLFDGLSEGDFYVKIPASSFSTTSVLSDWNVSPNGAASNDDENHDVDHNGMLAGPIATNGIVTSVITLSATAPAAGAAPEGDEPVGDNTLPIVDSFTNDSFSNLTIDIGLLSGDADNDGIADIVEFGSSDLVSVTDTDGDGTPDYLDADSDDDGIADAVETNADADLDGVPNHLDLDSDNDGIPDSTETQGDSDLDGIANYLDTDSNNNGITDTTEAGGDDVDGDGRIDNFTDANGDGENDSTAATPLSGPVDSDGDGIPDALEGTVDSDGDSISDRFDLDSDNDGISDNIEAGLAGVDTDGDGIDDDFDVDATGGADSNNDGLDDAIVAAGALDSDNDTIPDYLDNDSDADGIDDSVEGVIDSDADGLANYLDADSDNDGVLDVDEGNTDFDLDGTKNYLDLDSDNDNILDAVETNIDSDLDGMPDFIDLDSDNDGILDSVEGSTDTDSDGLSNYRDPDSDDDGISDADEGLIDSDLDGMGNYIDPDSDNDGILDLVEGNADSDLDGTKNYLDLDSDNDGIEDAVEGSVDTDADGLADFRDTDSDGDTISDTIEFAATTVDPTQCAVDEARISWTHNGNSGTSEAAEPDEFALPFVNSAANIAFGSGLSPTNSTYEWLVRDADQADFAGALADNDYAEFQFNVSESLYLYQILEGLSGFGPAAGEFGIAVAHSTDNFATSQVLYNNGEIGDVPFEGYTVHSRSVGLSLEPDVTHTFRFYYFDEQNSVTPNGTISVDDIALLFSVGCDNTSDVDNDGIPNHLDDDSDDDGILDSLEGNADTDNDGIFDFIDLDSDDDGIPDSLEGDADTDGDGIIDTIDPDSDNDGILDSIEGNIDSDLDGTPDFIDLDSDDDGIADLFEGNIDSDGDGVANYRDTDSDNDNIPDSVETTATSVDIGECAIEDARISWSHNGSSGASEAAEPDEFALPFVNSAEDFILGSGLTPTGSTFEWLVRGADQVDFAGAVADNDYAEFQFNVSETFYLFQILEGLSGFGPSAGEFGIAVAHSTDNFVTSQVLYADGEIGDVPFEGYTVHSRQVELFLEANVTHQFRFYYFNEQNTVSPNGTISIDDIALLFAIGCVNPDTDNDGILDFLDDDSDGDNILDIVEGITDTDSDGIADFIDIDSDDDGIPDLIEGSVDTDNDGVLDRFDDDSDDDGIDDLVEGFLDIDNDGLANYIDLTSDGDGIPDSVEGDDDFDNDGIPNFADTDSDGDTLPDAFEGVVDTDGDGAPNYLDLDSDGDTQLDAEESPVVGEDSDGDGVPNYLDLDSDSDGIPDEIEAQFSNGTVSGTSTDSDGDGIDDAIEAGPNPASPIDTDEDGIADFLDPDSDNDGISDVDETGFDSDAGGISNHLDLDADNDGIPDIVEGTLDTDLDGRPNYLDLDSDGDGIPDNVEGVFDAGNVIDTDGVVDADDLRDTDGDGELDFLDLDSDNDGISDADEASRVGLDSDSDGVDDYLDLDSDNDGILDADEGLAGLFNDGIFNDGVLDPTVNLDSDYDRIPNSVEGNVDSDGDGIVDSKDSDSDNDGIYDAVERTGDVDNDRIPNYLDLDSDNDGIRDLVEAGGEDINNDGIVDNFSDTNGDGLDDSHAFFPLVDLDTDGDGIVNRFDIDDTPD